MKSILYCLIVLLTATISAKVITSQVQKEYPTFSYSFVRTNKSVPTTPKDQRILDEEIKRLSKKYGQDEKLIKEIIRCEGKLYKNGDWEVHQNQDKYLSRDYGPMQINDHWHKAEMEKIGLNIYDWRDSLEYGVMLLNSKGTKPWTASKDCWNN